MKTKILIISFFLFSFSWALIAQDTETNGNQTTEETTKPEKKPKFWVGPKFGLDWSPLKINDIGNQLKNNYQFGLLFQYGRTFYIQPELMYANYKTPMIGDSTKTVSTNFLKVPVMLGLRFLNVGLFSLHIQTGPTLSLNLSDNDAYKNKTLTWQIGAGIDVLGFITADLRYTINNQSISNQIDGFNKNESMLNLTVGMKFR